MNVKTITQGALAISLIYIFFIIFKGPTNIINALLVPLTLYFSLMNQNIKGIIGVFSVLFLVCFLFFKVQIIFLFFYCAIALLLLILQKKKVPTFLSAVVLTGALSLSFWISIIMTDLIFLTHMSDIMLNIFKGNYLIFVMVIIFEGALVGISQLFVSKMLYKRLKKSF